MSFTAARYTYLPESQALQPRSKIKSQFSKEQFKHKPFNQRYNNDYPFKKKNMILYWTLGDFLINHIVNSCTKYPCTNENLWQEAGSIEVRAGSNDVCSRGIAFMKMSGVQFPW